MEHSFDISIAQKYGIQSAVLLKNIHFWIEKNKANEKNFYDGHYWTYNSRKAFADLFPYMTARQIDYALQRLIDDGVLVTGNYNKVAYDRTLWYAITKKGYSILQNCEMEVAKTGNGLPESVKPIPNSNTDVETSYVETYKTIISYLNEKVGSSYRPSTPKTQTLIKTRLKEGFTVDDFKTVIDNKTLSWKGTDMEQYLRPETLFGTKFEGYLNEKPVQKEVPKDEKKKRDEAYLRSLEELG